jgi:hypothetical protein
MFILLCAELVSAFATPFLRASALEMIANHS